MLSILKLIADAPIVVILMIDRAKEFNFSSELARSTP
jgi:hypothetical protein